MNIKGLKTLLLQHLITDRVNVVQKTNETLKHRGQTDRTGSEGNVSLTVASSAVWLDVGT